MILIIVRLAEFFHLQPMRLVYDDDDDDGSEETQGLTAPQQ